jgi:hypothetical protein
MNQCAFKHSAQNLPLKDSMEALSVGRSRHGAPDRKAIEERRSFTRGMPRGLFGSIGLMAATAQPSWRDRQL